MKPKPIKKRTLAGSRAKAPVKQWWLVQIQRPVINKNLSIIKSFIEQFIKLFCQSTTEPLITKNNKQMSKSV